MIVFNDAHLRRLVREYLQYYHDDRTHNALDKDTPSRRPVEGRRRGQSRLIAMSRLGGLHHPYTWRVAS
jgi:hypothetical protein